MWFYEVLCDVMRWGGVSKCGVMWWGATWWVVMRCCVMRCGVVCCGVMWCYEMWCDVMCVMRYDKVWLVLFVVMWWDVLWCGVLWCDVRWCDLICCDDNDEVWCDKVWRKVMWCDKVWCDVIGCDVGWCNVMWCDVIKCDVVWFEVMWWGVMWWDEVRCDVMWYSTVITFFKKLANTYLQVIQVLTYLLFSFCSPSQGLCCSTACTPQNDAFLCLNETECSNSSFCKYPLWICVSLQVMYRDQNISGLLSCKTHLKNYYGSAP